MSRERPSLANPFSTAEAPVSAEVRPPVCIDSTQLLQGARAVDIDHAGQRYVLRITRENKLILTK